MIYIIWSIIICLFLVSMIGVFVPIIPAVVFIWCGFLLYYFLIDSTVLSGFFWIIMIGFTVILISSDLLTNHYFVDKFGGGKRSQWGAIIGVLIGVFIYPPFGMIIVPFILVFLIEIFQEKSVQEASLASVGALVGFLSGIVAKFLIQLLMIAWFFITIILI